MKINTKKLFVAVTILFSGIPLFLHGYLGHFSRYIADDFCSAFQANRLGVLRAAWFWYLTWTGRYSASILDGVVGRLGPRAVPFVVPVTIIIWLAVLTALLMIFLHQLKERFLVSLALAAATLFTLFLLTPDLRGSLYWGQGMRSVVPPLLMGTVQIILLNTIRVREWTKLQLVFLGILSFLWALTAGGFSETYASFQAAALTLSLLIVLVVERFKSAKIALLLASGLAGAIGAMIIMILAPGNSERQAFYPPPPGIVSLVTISLQGLLVFTTRLVDSPYKVLAILGLFGLAVIAGSQLQPKMDPRLLIVVPVLLIGSIFTCFPPAAYGMSSVPPDRTLILPTYFFVTGLLALGIVCGNLLGEEQNFIVSKLLPALVPVAILISAVVNSTSLYRSRFEFIDYARNWDKAEAKIVEAKQSGATQVLIPIIPNWVLLETPNDNPRHWVNMCVDGYYGLQVLAKENPSPSTP